MPTAEPQQPADPVTDDTCRCQLSAAPSLEELPALDVVVIAGSPLDEDPDERVVHWLRRIPVQSTGRDGRCRAIAAEQADRARFSQAGLEARLPLDHRDRMPHRTKSIATHAGVDCPQEERRERTWPQSRAKKRGPANGRR